MRYKVEWQKPAIRIDGASGLAGWTAAMVWMDELHWLWLIIAISLFVKLGPVITFRIDRNK